MCLFSASSLLKLISHKSHTYCESIVLQSKLLQSILLCVILKFTLWSLTANWRLCGVAALFIASNLSARRFWHCTTSWASCIHILFFDSGKTWWLIRHPTDVFQGWEGDICRVSHALGLTSSVGKVFVTAAAVGFSCPSYDLPICLLDSSFGFKKFKTVKWLCDRF